MKSYRFYPAVLVLSLLFSCKPGSPANEGLDPLASHIDTTVQPGADFFQYANGAWFKAHPIPASEQSNGIFQLVQDTVNAQILEICTSAAQEKNPRKGSNKQKIGDFYASGMDSVSLNRKGLSDLKDELTAIDRIGSLSDLLGQVAHIHTIAGSPMLSLWVGQDDKNSAKYQIFIHQGGLSLPDKSYYLDSDARSKTIRKEFEAHVGRMYGILGYQPRQAASAANRLLQLETELAKASRNREDLRDPFANYHKMSFAELKKLGPDIDWSKFLQTAGLSKLDTVIVGQPEFVQALNRSLRQYALEDWKNYLKYQLVDALSPYLDDKTYLEDFGFYATVLRGVQQPRPRWKRVVEQTDGSLGELIGQVYVSEYLPKGTKRKLLEIGENIRTVYAGRIKTLDWMSDTTKQKALAKLDGVIMKVGYPDKWKDLSSLEIDRSSYVKNVMRANQWAFKDMTSKYGKPVDRNEWFMQPQTYNAYYSPSNNEICIPGCNIMVPGYERTMADDAILYAIIGGSTFGHEITHGFDDQGCKYDAAGNLSNWWTRGDSIRFSQKTKMIVEQFDLYEVPGGLKVNGSLTQGENIADLGGVVMGLEAFRKTKQFKQGKTIAGLTPMQRYFLGYAQAWMVNIRPEALMNQVRTDEHSPARFRVLGPLSNIPEFHEAFGVKPGDAMYRSGDKLVKIW